jgi:hypothetical protein
MTMKRLVLAVSLIAIATPAFAAGTTIVNHSGKPIDELFASEPGKKAWGENLMRGMKEGALEDGMTAEVAAVKDGTYDLQLSAPDEGVLCVIANVDIKGGKAELTPDMGKACQ